VAEQARRLAARIDVQAGALAAALALVWLAVGPRTPDLAAQSYRVGLFERAGFALWDNSWYSGHNIPGYSLIFPPLAAEIGERVVGALAAIAAAVCFARIAERHFGPRARAGVIWLAVASVLDLAIGRLTYDLGAALGLAAVWATQRDRLMIAACLSAVAATASPLAGAFVALAAVVLLVADARTANARRRALALGLPALFVVLALGGLFPEGGREPFAGRALAAALALTVVFYLLVGSRQRTLRVGAAVYLAATVAAYLLSTPMGGNVARLGAVFAGPLALCAIGPRRRGAAALGLLGLLGWQLWGPLSEIPKGINDPMSRSATYSGLVGFLERHDQPAARIEVPFTRSHWETAFLAPRFALARGWEKQLDTRYDALFYDGSFSAARYHAWLRTSGVHFVALPNVPLDRSSSAEVALLHRGVWFLREVWAGGLWRVFELADPLPLATPPATVTALGTQSFGLHFERAGTSVVRIRFSPYWDADPGCVAPAPGGWTAVSAPRGVALRVKIAFSVGRIFARGRRCSGSASSFSRTALAASG
jgi:hypothetical protein